jgi:hypothetical protein
VKRQALSTRVTKDKRQDKLGGVCSTKGRNVKPKVVDNLALSHEPCLVQSELRLQNDVLQRELQLRATLNFVDCASVKLLCIVHTCQELQRDTVAGNPQQEDNEWEIAR